MLMVEKASHLWRSRLIASTLLIGITPMLFASDEARAQGMNNMGTMPGMGEAKQSSVKTGTGTGTVTALNTSARKVTLEHGPIPSIPWPAMKMEFPVSPSVDLSKVKTGDKVEFTLSGSGSSYTVLTISARPQ